MCWPHRVGVCVSLPFLLYFNKIKGIQRGNKQGDTIFLLRFFLVSCVWIWIVPSLTKIWIVRHFQGNYLKGHFFSQSCSQWSGCHVNLFVWHPERRLRRRLRSLRNPTLTSFRFHVQKQSKAIEKTTLNWDIGPCLVYVHSVDITNRLHLALSYIYPCSRKAKRILNRKRRKKTVSPREQKACQVRTKFYRADDWYLRQIPRRLNYFSLDLSIWLCTESLARLLNHLTLD